MSKFWSTGDSDSSSSASENENDQSDVDWSCSEDGDEALGPPNLDDHEALLGPPNFDDNGNDKDSKLKQDHNMSEDPKGAWEELKKTQVFQDPILSTGWKDSDCVRIVCMSDTHGKHEEVRLPKGDILVHGGDFTKSGEVGNIKSLSRYFGDSGSTEVICIAGNHDLTLHPEFYLRHGDGFHSNPFNCQEAQDSLQNCVYLKDASHTTTHGIEVYGSPWSPEFFNWAFNMPRGKAIREIWDQIPETTDVLITHGPPLGRGDQTYHSGRVGCYDLLLAVQERIKPRVHIFGHIHEAAGVTFDGHTLYVNASTLNRLKTKMRPVVIDVPLDQSKPAMVVTPECSLPDSSALLEWLKANNFHQLVGAMESCDNLGGLPYGNDLLKEDAYTMISEQLMFRERRDGRLVTELYAALNELYAQSFS